jgi:hypothetical protein
MDTLGCLDLARRAPGQVGVQIEPKPDTKEGMECGCMHEVSNKTRAPITQAKLHEHQP